MNFKHLPMHNYTLNNLFAGMNRTVRSLVVFAVLFLTGMQASAQVPVNDDPCGAIVLTPAAACTYQTFTNVDGSLTTGVPAPAGACGSLTDADVWFKVTVPAAATAVTIDLKNLTPGGILDGAMTIYSVTGTCPTLTLTQVACDDDSSPNPSMPKITVPGVPGTVFYVRVYGFGGETGTFGICATATIPPANDDCLNAQALTVNPDYLCGVIAGGTTLNANQSTNTPTPTCGATNGWNDDVWYSFVATGVGHRIVLSAVSGGTSMTMQVYSGTCGSLTPVAGGCINGNTLDLTGLTAGTTYLVRVYTNTATVGTTATFNICVGTAPPPPPNDDCVNATSLTVNADLLCGVTTAGTTVSATQTTVTTTPATPSCGTAGGINDDVWYKFTATGPTHWVSLSNVSGGTAMTFTVFSGTCAAGFTELGCNTTNGPAVITGLTAGTVLLCESLHECCYSRNFCDI